MVFKLENLWTKVEMDDVTLLFCGLDFTMVDDAILLIRISFSLIIAFDIVFNFYWNYGKLMNGEFKLNLGWSGGISLRLRV